MTRADVGRPEACGEIAYPDITVSSLTSMTAASSASIREDAAAEDAIFTAAWVNGQGSGTTSSSLSSSLIADLSSCQCVSTNNPIVT
jgi:hypothetical protein